MRYHLNREYKFLDFARTDRRRLRIQILVVILALGRELDGLIATSLGILEDFAFVIANDDYNLSA